MTFLKRIPGVLLKRKHLGQFSVDELNKRASWNLGLFWGYVIAALIVMATGSYVCWNMLNDVMSFQVDASTKLILILLVMNVVNFFLLFWLWFITESSYYKMEQEFSELMAYLKEQEGKK